MTSKIPNDSELAFFDRDNKSGNTGLSSFNNKDLSELTNFLKDSSKTHIIPSNKRSIETTISTESPSLWKGKNYEYNFEVTRKVEGLPSVWINKMQHSGTHFINSRLSILGYGRCDLQQADNPWIDTNMVRKLIQGGYASLTELHPNLYNAHLFNKIIKETPIKVVLHFRDPRSIMVSSINLMYRKGSSSPEQVYENSLKYPDAIIPLDFPSKSFEQRLEFYIFKYYPRWALFVNEWFDLIANIKPVDRKKVLVREFNTHLTGQSEQYLRELLKFLDVKGKGVQVLDSFFDPTLANSHFRKGLTDEWREVCTKDQIEWMTKQIHPRTLEFFGWAKN